MNLLHYKTAIFDLDGLLIDSDPYWNIADTLLLKKRNIVFTKEIHAMSFGFGQRETVSNFKKAFGLKDSVDSLVKERGALLYEALMPNLILMPGAKDVIVYLKQRGVVLAIATGGHSKNNISEILTKLQIGEYFSLWISGEEVKHNKPHPEIYVKCAKLLQSDPKHCMAFEDSTNGVTSAYKAGLYVIAVNSDQTYHADLIKHGAAQVFMSFTEYLKALQSETVNL